MGLMHLLTATRSLDEAKYPPHRYKLMRDRWPTFGNDSVERSRGEVAEGVTERNAMKTEVAEQSATPAPKQAFPLGRWTKNPFRSTAIPSQRATAVQGELSLDKVKPVRNDLSDSDLELMPRKQSEPEKNPFATTKEAPVAREEIAQKPGLFARMKARLFRQKAE